VLAISNIHQQVKREIDAVTGKGSAKAAATAITATAPGISSAGLGLAGGLSGTPLVWGTS